MSKTLELSPAASEGATRMKALGDPIRWSVVRLLSEGERCVCDLESAIGISQSRLSYHLAILRDADIVSDRKSGRWVYYSLAPDILEDAIDELRAFVDTWRIVGSRRAERTC